MNVFAYWIDKQLICILICHVRSVCASTSKVFCNSYAYALIAINVYSWLTGIWKYNLLNLQACNKVDATIQWKSSNKTIFFIGKHSLKGNYESRSTITIISSIKVEGSTLEIPSYVILYVESSPHVGDSPYFK